jgi:hypothetical protein
VKFVKPLAISALSIVALMPAKAAPNNIAFMQMLADTGCKSRYSDDKKADLFASNYKNKQMTVTGEIATLSSNDLSLKVLPATLTFDVIIKLADSKAGYDLEKGQRVTMTFVVNSAGGCLLSYSGDRGVIQN